MGSREDGAYLREQRLALQLSQEQVGNRAGMTGKTVGNVENGRTTPDVSTIKAIAEVLGVDAGYVLSLLGGSDQGYISPEDAARAVNSYRGDEKRRFFDLIGLGAIRNIFDRERD